MSRPPSICSSGGLSSLPGPGARLLSGPVLDGWLAGAGLTFRVHRFHRLTSTQDRALSMAATGAPEGTVVIAAEQSQGRGRRGAGWFAPQDSSLLISLLLRPLAGPRESSELSLVAGLALAEAMEELRGPRLQLKWPNDCLSRGKKLAGILLERTTGEVGPALVLGLGCNLRWKGLQLPDDLPAAATSCDLEGCELTAVELAVAFLLRLDRRYREWLEGGFGGLRGAWLERAAYLGEEIEVQLGSGPVRGRMLGVDEEGALLVETGSGTERVVAAEALRTRTRAEG